MTTLKDIEQKFGFEYPEIYHRLGKAQMLDWMRGWNEPLTAGRNWYTEIFPTLVDNPPLLLHNHDFELYTFDNIVEELETIPDYWNPQHQLVPIGMNGAGDWFAFYFTGKTNNDIPIVFAPHDDEEATYLAKNMEDFIFRMLLEYAADIDEDLIEDMEENTEKDFKTNIMLMLESHRPYLLPEYYEIIKEAYNRPMIEYEYGLDSSRPYKNLGMLGQRELEQIIKDNIGFDKLDTKFKFML